MYKSTMKKICFTGFVIFLFTSSICAQDSKCYFDEDGNVVCEIKEGGKDIIGPFRVENSSNVIIRVTNKSLYDDCDLGEIKTTEIKQDDPIVKILQIFTKSFTGISLPAGSSLTNDGTLTKEELNLINTLISDARDLLQKVNKKTTDSKTFIDNQEKFVKLTVNPLILKGPRSPNEYNSKTFGKENKTVKQIIEGLRKYQEEADKIVKSFAGEKILYEDLVKRSKEILELKNNADQTKATLIQNNVLIIYEILSNIDASFSRLKSNYDSINEAEKEFGKLSLSLSAKETFFDKEQENAFKKDLPLLHYNQQKVVTSVVCTNELTGKPAATPIPVTVLYKSDPKLSVSAGPLFSTLPKQKLGITQVNTGLNDENQPTFRSDFGIVDRASIQVIPFFFLNYRLNYLDKFKNPTKSPKFSINLSGGIGVNPNSGTNEVEFFVGPSIGYKRFFFQFGDHIGRFQEGFTGGFNIGDPFPAGFPSTLPIKKVYKHRFGFAISYRITN